MDFKAHEIQPVYLVIHSDSLRLQENLLPSIYEHKVHKGLSGAEALESAFLETNSDLRKLRSAYICGSTATAVVLDGSPSTLRILCANSGDSPAFVVNRSGQYKNLVKMSLTVTAGVPGNASTACSF